MANPKLQWLLTDGVTVDASESFAPENGIPGDPVARRLYNDWDGSVGSVDSGDFLITAVSRSTGVGDYSADDELAASGWIEICLTGSGGTGMVNQTTGWIKVGRGRFVRVKGDQGAGLPDDRTAPRHPARRRHRRQGVQAPDHRRRPRLHALLRPHRRRRAGPSDGLGRRLLDGDPFGVRGRRGRGPRQHGRDRARRRGLRWRPLRRHGRDGDLLQPGRRRRRAHDRELLPRARLARRHRRPDRLDEERPGCLPALRGEPPGPSGRSSRNLLGRRSPSRRSSPTPRSTWSERSTAAPPWSGLGCRRRFTPSSA
jgi:hypothetical protein